MYQTNDTKVILHQEDFTLQGSTIFFSQNLVCWSDSGLLDLFDKNLCISTPVFSKNWLIEAFENSQNKVHHWLHWSDIFAVLDPRCLVIRKQKEARKIADFFILIFRGQKIIVEKYKKLEKYEKNREIQKKMEIYKKIDIDL